MLLNQTRAARWSDFKITHMISDQISITIIYPTKNRKRNNSLVTFYRKEIPEKCELFFFRLSFILGFFRLFKPSIMH